MFIVAILNRVFTLLFGVVYFPLKWLGPFWSLLAISGLAGLLLVWIFGKVSDQEAIERTRDRLSGELIGLRLFKDDLKVACLFRTNHMNDKIRLILSKKLQWTQAHFFTLICWVSFTCYKNPIVKFIF